MPWEGDSAYAAVFTVVSRHADDDWAALTLATESVSPGQTPVGGSTLPQEDSRLLSCVRRTGCYRVLVTWVKVRRLLDTLGVGGFPFAVSRVGLEWSQALLPV